MINYREVNNDNILKEWYTFMEETYLWYVNEQDRDNEFNYNPFKERILKNVSKKNKKYIEKQLNLIFDEFMKYVIYINEKYYRNRFVDSIQLIKGCYDCSRTFKSTKFAL